MNECKPLLYGMLTARAAATLLTYLLEMNKAGATFFQVIGARGFIHSFTFQLNVRAVCGIGGAVRGRLRIV